MILKFEVLTLECSFTLDGTSMNSRLTFFFLKKNHDRVA